MKCWVNGEPSTVVAAHDRGLQYGDGVFETLICRQGRLCWLERHLERLQRGLLALGIAMPGLGELRAGLQAAAGSEPGDGIVKLIVTRGVATARGYRAQGDERTTTIISRLPLPPPPTALQVEMSPVRLGHNPLLAGIKHLNRLEQVLAQRQLGAGCDEVLMLDQAGRVICGSMSNLYLVRADGLVTPRLDRCGVAGIMRSLVMEGARALAIDCSEADVEPSELRSAASLWMSNVRLGLCPVTRLAGRALLADERLTAIRRWIDAHAA